ncbi:carnitine dehydratase [Sporosarcina sp. P13]|uniref:CaiB/BaiF CoA transferase family protein n=1 Tax=Sporosarcina sp. P13 TaxID=2048263 RepID=UPI000C162B2D|nr:CoA transferase [Sporosarcina sp. P13]PIC63472.1 carnitine dehydratase [Sporosarcina sp. P13]
MKPLQGIKVVDFTQSHGGSATTMYLADFGAEVIKIERREYGDPARSWPPFKESSSAYFSLLNRGKKSITLDLRKEEGVEVIRKLVMESDIIVENFKAGTMESYGLGYEDIKKINPKIIYAQLTGFGSTGPLKDYPAYDIVVQAMSGIMDVTGFSDGPPTKMGPPVGDYFSAVYLTAGINMALFNRERTGIGQKVELGMVDALVSALEDKIAHYSVANVMPSRVGNAHPMIAPYDTLETKDGYVSLGISTDNQWENFCMALDISELAVDKRYNSNEKRGANYFTSLRVIIESITKTLTTSEILQKLDHYQIPAGKVNTVVEALELPQTKARDMLVEITDKSLGKVKVPGIHVKLHGTPGSIDKGAPLLGYHTEEVLESIGYSQTDISELRDKKII